MENFKYVGRDSGGTRKEGFRRAQSHLEVLTWLRSQDLTPVSVQKYTGTGKAANTQGGRRSVKSADLSSFCWQMSTMIQGGVPLTTAITTISEDIESRPLKHALLQISEKINQGETLSDSVTQFPGVFNQLSCSMILAGESGGSLPYCLERLAIYFDNRDKLARKVKTAMSYPVFVVTFVFFIVLVIMTFIIPKFQVIFKQMGGKLPAFTQGYLGVYEVICHNAVFIIAGSLALIGTCVFYSRTPQGHKFFSTLLLKIPILGKIVSQAFVATFCRVFSSLLSSGVPVLEALNILAGISKNDVIRSAVLRTREHIIGGSSISIGLASSGFFPNMVVKMVQVGEESGSMPEVLDRTSEYYERRIDSLISMLTSVLEPALIIIVGGIVLVTVLALYLPVFSLSDIKQ